MRDNSQARQEGWVSAEGLMQNRCIAEDYLADRPQFHGQGVVVIFKGQAAGWMDSLRDPQGWEPGCFAVDADGNQWQAAGGDSYSGAEAWQPLFKALAPNGLLDLAKTAPAAHQHFAAEELQHG